MDQIKPATIINENGRSDWLLVCEHARNNVPPELNQLGLTDNVLTQHIGHDIGTYEMTLSLSEKLDATAIICNYSRLVIDCNRVINATDCIPKISDGIVIPRNQNLDPTDKLHRINTIYQPFHATVAQVLAKKLITNPKTKFANIHSFTPKLFEEDYQRPWEIGFIYRDPQPTRQLIDYLRKNTNYKVGDNEPYDGFTHKGYTIPVHADGQNIPSFLVEFRQNLIDSPAGVKKWSQLLIDAIGTLENV